MFACVAKVHGAVVKYTRDTKLRTVVPAHFDILGTCQSAIEHNHMLEEGVAGYGLWRLVCVDVFVRTSGCNCTRSGEGEGEGEGEGDGVGEREGEREYA